MRAWHPRDEIRLELDGRAMTNAAGEQNDRTEGFMRLLTAHERRVEGFVMSLVPNWADADEVIQETKLRLWQQYHEYDATKDFGAWACTIAYYQVLTMRNRNRSQHVRFGDAFLEKVAVEAARDSERIVYRQHVFADCLRNLSEAKQLLLRRCYGGHNTIIQIAAELGRKAESVRQELVRIRRTLYRCIQEAQRQEESL
jgi:RNA polymerase sigma-70 factor, ECF subfamily